MLGIAFGGLGLVGGLIATVMGRGGKAEGFLLVLGCLAVCAFAVFYYYIGVGLMDRKSWARIAFAVLFVLGLLMRGLGLLLGDPSQACSGGFALAWGGAQMWALFGDRANRVFSPGYARATHGDRRAVPWAKSPFFWLPLVMIVLIVGFFFLAILLAVLAR